MRAITVTLSALTLACVGVRAGEVAAQPRPAARMAAPAAPAASAAPWALAPRRGFVGGTPGARPPRGVPPGAVALSAWDCNTVGGTVVTVFDGRCGSSGQYCRMPNSWAACIDERR